MTRVTRAFLAARGVESGRVLKQLCHALAMRHDDLPAPT